MDPIVKEALSILGFGNPEKLPKLKEIRKRFMKLSLVHHPDKNNGSLESKTKFQAILRAYETLGTVLQDTLYDDDDHEDEVARKMFRQFSFSAVKENLSSFTIVTEKPLNQVWREILCDNFGQPLDLKNHGLKFTFTDTCKDTVGVVFVTLYKTGKCSSKPKATSTP